MPITKIAVKLTFLSNTNSILFNLNMLPSGSKVKNLKYFLYFLCFFHLLLKKKKSNFNVTKPKVLVLPKVLKKFTLLRAPFRHKLTKKNYTLIRYKSIVFFNLNLNSKLKVHALLDCVLILNSLLLYFYWFETNTQNLHSIKVCTPVLLKKLNYR